MNQHHKHLHQLPITSELEAGTANSWLLRRDMLLTARKLPPLLRRKYPQLKSMINSGYLQKVNPQLWAQVKDRRPYLQLSLRPPLGPTL